MSSESPTHPDAPRAGGETPDPLRQLEIVRDWPDLDETLDGIVSEWAEHGDAEGDCLATIDAKRAAYIRHAAELIRTLRSALPSLLERHRDGERWRALVAVLDLESMRTPEPGALILWTMRSNQWDAPKASIQSIAWRAPSRTLWIEEGETINEAMDRVLAGPSAERA